MYACVLNLQWISKKFVFVNSSVIAGYIQPQRCSLWAEWLQFAVGGRRMD